MMLIGIYTLILFSAVMLAVVSFNRSYKKKSNYLIWDKVFTTTWEFIIWFYIIAGVILYVTFS
jgi:hypothetical protein